MTPRIRGMLALIWLNGFLPTIRGPMYVLTYMASPLSIVFFIYIFGGEKYAPFAYAGGLLSVVVTNSSWLLGDAVHLRVESRFQDMVVASPMTASAYVVGLAASELVYALPGIGVFVALLASAGLLSLYSVLASSLAMLLVWAGVTSISFAASTFFREIKQIWPFSTLFSMLLSFLPPVFYPITIVPEAVKWITYLTPTTHAALVIHASMGLVSADATTLQLHWVALGAYTVLLVLLASRLARWRER